MSLDPPTPEDLEIDAYYQAELEAKQSGERPKRASGLSPEQNAMLNEMQAKYPGKSLGFCWDKAVKEFARRAAKVLYPWLPIGSLVEPLPPVEWICKELRIAPGAVTCFAGYGYSGKTALAQLMVLSVACGNKLFGLFPMTCGPSAHLDFEQGSRLSRERYQRLAMGLGLDLSQLVEDQIRYVPLPNLYLDDSRAQEALEQLCYGCKLLVIDSLRAGVVSMDENDSKIRRYLDVLARVSEATGCAIVVIHHYNKEGDVKRDRRQRMRGSSALFDACQTVWGFEAQEKKPIICTLDKDRLTGQKGEKFGIQFVDQADGSLSIVHLDAEQLGGVDRMRDARDSVVACIRQFPGIAGPESIRERVGIAMGAVRAAVRELEDEGIIVNNGKTNRPRLYLKAGAK